MGELKDVVTREKRESKISERVGARSACLIVYASEDPSQVGRRHELTDKVVTIGRSPNSTIVIESETVSRTHARIERGDRGLILVDCGSVNGTYVGDERVGEHALRSGDLIKIGPCILKYLAAGDIEATYHEEISTDATGAQGTRSLPGGRRSAASSHVGGRERRAGPASSRSRRNGLNAALGCPPSARRGRPVRRGGRRPSSE
jgi:predicted component of type VI protein secretion system